LTERQQVLNKDKYMCMYIHEMTCTVKMYAMTRQVITAEYTG